MCAILDEGFICHVACVVDGTVWMIPTAYGRDGDRLLLHGAAANHVLKAAAGGAELTITVTLLDGMVLARSTFHHSINYRSVVIFGPATEITEAEGEIRRSRPDRRPPLTRTVRETPGARRPRSWPVPGWSICP